MSNNQIERPAGPRTAQAPAVAPVPSPGRIGQGTVVEQSRAAAEVLAAVQVAQQFPRDIQRAKAQMRDSCAQERLAERAFYRYRRGGSAITGPTVHLARELARCWGHVQHGLIELRRDDEYHQSEMQAFAWDVQENTRVASTFIVPHIRDTQDGPVALTDMRDIYENNTNQGSRRVREMILAVLPPWFVEEAKDLCQATLREGGGLPLAQRIANCISKFADVGVSLDQLEAKQGRPNGRWTEFDTAQLAIIWRSLERREITVEDEFPPVVTTAEEIIAARTPKPAPATPDAPAANEAPAGQESPDGQAARPTAPAQDSPADGPARTEPDQVPARDGGAAADEPGAPLGDPLHYDDDEVFEGGGHR
ncbi:hypothetical protein [Actinomadura opuntiae]|uniref:hypothetical protein n=1 Tax=Actinomadura sp. OS1-43 TaxID=604315 RepID=UPI00255AA3AD|nr:hypothetical protein [Actinomadura sp. OS1-43]MDL4812730.1 hypothetical protein [Actinomadura sp. OS1-43]